MTRSAAEACAVLTVLVSSSAPGCGLGGPEPLTEGLHPVMAGLLEPCVGLPVSQRDHCAYAALEGGHLQAGLAGEDVVVVCPRLQEEGPRGWCVELAMGLRNPPDQSACELIPEEATRESCSLTSLDREMASMDIADLVTACEALEGIREHCYAHISFHRADAWLQGGPELFSSELDFLAKQVPDIEEMGGFGQNVGQVVARMGGQPRTQNACSAFPRGTTARRYCEGSVATSTGLTLPGAGPGAPQGAQPRTAP